MPAEEENNKFITSTAENMEKIFKLIKERFDDSIGEVSRADKKLNIYFLIINISIFLYGTLYGKFFSEIFINSKIKLNFPALLVLIFGLILAVLIATIFFITLSSLKQITLDSHPTWQKLNEFFSKTEKDFWSEMIKYYISIDFKNRKKIQDKKNKIKKIEILLKITFFISIFAFLSYILKVLVAIEEFCIK